MVAALVSNCNRAITRIADSSAGRSGKENDRRTADSSAGRGSSRENVGKVQAWKRGAGDATGTETKRARRSEIGAVEVLWTTGTSCPLGCNGRKGFQWRDKFDSHWRACHYAEVRMNRCLACDATFRRMATLREHVFIEHGCEFKENRGIPFHWYRVDWAPNSNYTDPSPHRFQPISRLPDDPCRGIARGAWKTFSRDSLLEEMARRARAPTTGAASEALSDGPNTTELLLAKPGATAANPRPVGHDAAEPLLGDSGATTTLTAETSVAFQGLFPGSPVNYAEIDLMPWIPPTPQAPTTGVQSRLQLIAEGKTQPPTAETVKFTKGPDMVVSANEMSADVTRVARTFESFTASLNERHEGWMKIDRDRKCQEVDFKAERAAWETERAAWTTKEAAMQERLQLGDVAECLLTLEKNGAQREVEETKATQRAIASEAEREKIRADTLAGDVKKLQEEQKRCSEERTTQAEQIKQLQLDAADKQALDAENETLREELRILRDRVEELEKELREAF